MHDLRCTPPARTTARSSAGRPGPDPDRRSGTGSARPRDGSAFRRPERRSIARVDGDRSRAVLRSRVRSHLADGVLLPGNRPLGGFTAPAGVRSSLAGGASPTPRLARANAGDRSSRSEVAPERRCKRRDRDRSRLAQALASCPAAPPPQSPQPDLGTKERLVRGRRASGPPASRWGAGVTTQSSPAPGTS